MSKTMDTDSKEHKATPTQIAEMKHKIARYEKALSYIELDVPSGNLHHRFMAAVSDYKCVASNALRS